MRIPQISLIVENKPGAMIAPCELLSRAGINIVTLSLAESPSCGTLRLIVAEAEQACELLKQAGYDATLRDVLAIEVVDEPGGLLELLRIFRDAQINVATMYAFTSRLGDSAVLIFNFDDVDAAIAALTRAGINPVAPVYLYDRIEEEE